MSQSINDETTGFTATLKPEVTNGANEVDAKRAPILTYKDNAKGKMVGQDSTIAQEEDGTESQPGKLYPLSDSQEDHVATFGDAQ